MSEPAPVAELTPEMVRDPVTGRRVRSDEVSPPAEGAVRTKTSRRKRPETRPTPSQAPDTRKSTVVTGGSRRPGTAAALALAMLVGASVAVTLHLRADVGARPTILGPIASGTGPTTTEPESLRLTGMAVRNAQGRITQIRARTARSVLETFCLEAGGSGRRSWEAVDIQPTVPYRQGVMVGILQPAENRSAPTHGIWIRRGPDRRWSTGDGLKPIVPVPYSAPAANTN